jgi:hypothetical protein
MNDLPISGDTRDEIARIIEMVAAEGLPHPRHLDAAIDAIGSALQGEPVQKVVDEKGSVYWIDRDDNATDSFGDNIVATRGLFIPQEDS